MNLHCVNITKYIYANLNGTSDTLLVHHQVRLTQMLIRVKKLCKLVLCPAYENSHPFHCEHVLQLPWLLLLLYFLHLLTYSHVLLTVLLITYQSSGVYSRLLISGNYTMLGIFKRFRGYLSPFLKNGTTGVRTLFKYRNEHNWEFVFFGILGIW